MKALSFLYEGIYAAKSGNKGRGMFTRVPLPPDTLIEIAPVIVMSGDDRKHIDLTLLHDYIFEWGTNRTQCCMALGYVPLYNHSYSSNCEYQMNFKKDLILIRTVREILKGEELTINYNGDWNDEKPVWFDVQS